MNNLVDVLRAFDIPVCHEAAFRIEELEEENAKLFGALEEFVKYHGTEPTGTQEEVAAWIKADAVVEAYRNRQ